MKGYMYGLSLRILLFLYTFEFLIKDCLRRWKALRRESGCLGGVAVYACAVQICFLIWHTQMNAIG